MNERTKNPVNFSTTIGQEEEAQPHQAPTMPDNLLHIRAGFALFVLHYNKMQFLVILLENL